MATTSSMQTSAPQNPRRRLRKRWIAAAAFMVFIVTCYIVWTRVSAVHVLRRFVKQMGIPVEVRSASWDMRISELLNGQIRDLRFEIYYPPLNATFAFDTPVSYVRKQNNWTIRLQPTMRVNKFPPAKGTIDLDLQGKSGASVAFDLHDAKPIKFADDHGSLEAKSWQLRGNVIWSETWDGKADFEVKDVKLHHATLPESLTIKSIKIENIIRWPSGPPLPLVVSSKITTGPIDFLFDKMFHRESGLDLKSSFEFDGETFHNVDISVDKPARIRIGGSYGEKLKHLKLDFKGSLEELVTKRLGKSIGPLVPPLRGANAEGDLHLSATLNGNTLTGKIVVNAKHSELPARGTTIENLTLNMPLSFPEEPAWGRLQIAKVEYQSMHLRDIGVLISLSADGLDLTTVNDNGVDKPIRQSLWGSSIDIENLYTHIGGKEGVSLSLGVRGGPFQIEQIQKDLCILPKQPLKGTVKVNYPELVHDHDSAHLMGTTDLVILGGTAHVGDLHLSLKGHDPQLSFGLNWDDVDMHAVGDWTHFGDMRGSIDGALKNAVFALTSIGPIPMSYDFSIHGSPRSGKMISFYGRAVNNVLELMGSPTKDLPFYAKMGISISTLFRNLVPAKAQCLGFKAKADRSWTELSTYDDECCTAEDYENRDNDCPADKKSHYILRGSGFKIPLIAHGVYPVIMKTDAFQSWLAGRIQYFKEIGGNGKKPEEGAENECIPLW